MDATPTRLRRDAPAETLFERADAGDRVALSWLLSDVERGGSRSRAVAALAYRAGVEARTVGITGAPGAGKSTLTNGLIAAARAAGVERVAVLAVDPSSPFSGGAILGDRVRMQDHVLEPSVFIRSLASRGHLGGLALAAPEALRLLGATGIPLVLVETVGVGQVEVEVADATDTTVVVVNPRWGDAVQANKAGLLEVADVFVINKADMPGARETRRDLEQMLELGASAGWRPPIVETVASSAEGLDELWAQIAAHQRHLDESGTLLLRRRQRLENELRRHVREELEQRIGHRSGEEAFARAVEELLAGRADPYSASRLLVEALDPRSPEPD